MRLRRSSLFILMVAGAVAVTFACATTDTLLLLSVDRLQEREALASAPRLRRLVEQEQQRLLDLTSEWAAWDPALRFVTQGDPAFVTARLIPSVPRALGVGTIAYVDFEGRILAQIAGRSGDGSEPAIGLLGQAQLAPDGPLLSRLARSGQAQGLIAGRSGGLLVAARTVTDSRGAGSSTAAVVLVRAVDDVRIQSLSQLLGRPLRVRRSEPGDPAVDLVAGDDGRDTVRVRLDDLAGRPLLTAEIDQERWMRREVAAALPQTRAAEAQVRDLVVALMWWTLDRKVFRRLEGLREAVAVEDGTAVTDPDEDEITALGRTFDQAISRSRSALATAAGNEDRFRALFQQSAEAVLLVDDGLVVDGNRAALRLFAAQRREDLIGQPYSRLAGVERAGSARHHRTPTADLMERVMRRLDGRSLTTEVRESVIEVDGRRMVQVLARDLGERLRDEHERRLLASVLEATSDCVAVTSSELRTLFLNGAGRRMLGLPDEGSSDGVDLTARVAPEHRALLAEGVRQAIAGHGWRGEVELELDPLPASAGGTGIQVPRRLPVSWILVAVGDGGLSPARLGSIIRDVSEERSRRTRLEEASRTATETARAKDSFLATVSHELRSPLGGVIGMASLLRETPLADDQREMADTIHLCAGNLLALINDILDLSKMEAGALTLERMPFDPRAVAEEAVQILAEQALGKGLEIGCLAEPGVPARVGGDPTRLRQVLVNLVGNAVKFTERGEVLLRIECLPHQAGDPANQVRLRFRCRDSGIGIEPEAQARLFQPFSQAEAGTTRRFGGSGLGLAISQRLVGLMGGVITLESRPGVGSEFAFDLCLPEERVATAELPPDLHGIHVLVVDPRPTARRIARTMLASVHAQVSEAASVAQAAAALKNQRPAVVLASIDQPDGRIEDLARLVAESGGAVRLVCTAPVTHAQADQVVREAGADGLVHRPLRAAQLIRAVAGAISRRTPRTAPHRIAGPAHGLTVLVADDDPVNRQLLLRMLDSLGAERVVVAQDGTEALAALGAEPFACALLDCRMPGLDGLEVARRHRAYELAEDLPRTPLVACSAHLAGDLEGEALAAGFDRTLAKPFPVNALRACLADLLGPATVAQRPERTGPPSDSFPDLASPS